MEYMYEYYVDGENERDPVEILNKTTKELKNATTYPAFYRFWFGHLSDMLTRLFVYDGIDDANKKYPGLELNQESIEMPLLIGGVVGFTTAYDGTPTPFQGSCHTPTKYYNIKEKFTARCPKWAKTLKIGTECEVVYNNDAHTGLVPLVHHYACMLGHTDTTIIYTLVNARMPVVPVAQTQKQLQSIQTVQNKIYRGHLGVITDNGGLGVERLELGSDAYQNIRDMLETKERLLKEFYADIGVRAQFQKVSNAITDEITSDSALLKLNLSEMLRNREEGLKRVNEHYGLNLSVHINDALDYDALTGSYEGVEGTKEEVKDNETMDDKRTVSGE